MANDWDLFAIVRSCSAAGAAAAKYPKRDGNGGNDEVRKNLFSLHGIFSFGDRNEVVDDDSLDELQHVYRPFYRKAQPAAVAGSEKKHQPVESQSEKGKPEVPLPRRRQGNNVGDNGAISRRLIPSPSPARRRKCRPRLMMRMNAKTVSKDSWSWRKYGQKPIKGSPHPRNYYRCSTSKACSARKQVELSQDNPEEYIVSYIGEHIHARPTTRRSTAATARNLPPPCAAAAAATAVTDLSPTTPLNPVKGNENENSGRMFEEEEEEEGEECDILVPNMKISEETFMAMHVVNSRASKSTVIKPHYPAKDSVKTARRSH